MSDKPIETVLRQWVEALRTDTIAEHSISDIAIFNGGCVTDDIEAAANEIERLRSALILIRDAASHNMSRDGYFFGAASNALNQQNAASEKEP